MKRTYFNSGGKGGIRNSMPLLVRDLDDPSIVLNQVLELEAQCLRYV